MKLKVKDMDIATGGIFIAILNEEDARKFDLYSEDRIKLKKGKKETTAIVDIAESEKAVPKGKIGLFEEVLDCLDVKHNQEIEVIVEEKPASIFFIKRKLEGNKLGKKELEAIVKSIVKNELSEIELAYFISAAFTKGLDIDEIVNLTKSIVDNGRKLDIRSRIILDKHCSGGVPGNRTTMLVVPIIAAAGLTIPKTSSRSITSPSGTADTMEVLAPVDQDIKKMKKVVEKTNGCIMWGGKVDLASADDKLIRIRHPLSLDPEGMLLASIMAKKSAVGAKKVLIDIPVGRDTKVKTMKDAAHLKKMFKKVGSRLGMDVHVIITDGREPIGRGIGPMLEARDILWILKRDKRRPVDLEDKAVKMAAKMMKMAGIKNPSKRSKEILDSGFAYEKMKQIIKAQGGNPDIDPDKMNIGKFSYEVKAKKSGTIKDIDNFSINKVARIAGAPKNKGAGIYIHKHESEKVKKGELLMTIYAESKQKLDFAVQTNKEYVCYNIR